LRQIGRYRLDHTVGSGAFATVWKGYDPELDTAVAVKVLADNWSFHADVRERFLSEARLLRRTESRRVVRVHDVGMADDRPYFVMDYVHGGTLADVVGKVPPEEAVRLAVEAAEAVHVLHQAGFVHRDIKPSNLLLDQTCEPVRVLVADLGSAKRLADASGFTVTTGTPAYMAPEQAAGTDGFDGRADVYSLAVVTWELLTGSRPPEPLPSSRRRTSGQAPRRRLPTEVAGISPRVVDVLEAALDPEPDRRPPDAQAFARALLAADAPADPARRGWSALLVWTAAVLVFGLALVVGWLVF
jgi:eukaryotic-like serine/threonine-protein kinase